MKNFPKARFLDSIRLTISGGSAGNGLPKFNGIGGKGGNVIAIGDSKSTFKNILNLYPNRKLVAGRGDDARMFALQGAPGTSMHLKVPLGTAFYIPVKHNSISSPSNNKTIPVKYKYIGELNKEGDKLELANGGAPGSENNLYHGQAGEKHIVRIELKLLADVGLVGFPNAGKSSLLKSMSNANPKIANYPFTTLMPQLGVLEYKDDFREITMADLPGLIEDAHTNHGLGHNFLKHIERTKLLIFLIDINGFKLDIYSKFRTAEETLALLLKEIELYNTSLLNKPALLVFNKNDLINDSESQKLSYLMNLLKENSDNLSKFVNSDISPQSFIHFHDVISISTKTNLGINALKKRIRDVIDFYALENIKQEISSISHA